MFTTGQTLLRAREDEMYKGASDKAQGRRDRGLSTFPGPKPLFKKEAALRAKKENRKGKPGSWKRLKATWDD